MQTITEQLKRGNLSRVQLIYGEERYMVRYYKNGLKQKLSQPDDEMNCTVFSGEKAVPSAIADVAQILPFMAPQRLVVIQESGLFKKASDMVDFIENFPDTTYVVFVESEVDKRNRLYKWVSKNGCVTECRQQNAATLGKWVAGYVKRAGKSITPEASALLMERVGSDMELLSGELEKLIAFTGEKTSIDRTEVEAISSGVTVSRIFDMIDAVAQREQKKALRLYGDLVENKESPMSILYLFSRHINILLQIKELIATGAGQGEIAKKIGIPPFTVKKYAAQAQHFKRKQLLKMLESRADSEEKFKSGRLSENLAAELFLIQALTNS